MNCRNYIEPLHYIDATTGKILATISMRVFEIQRKQGWEKVRYYELSKEHEINPGFGKAPQNDRAFPDRERY